MAEQGLRTRLELSIHRAKRPGIVASKMNERIERVWAILSVQLHDSHGSEFLVGESADGATRLITGRVLHEGGTKVLVLTYPSVEGPVGGDPRTAQFWGKDPYVLIGETKVRPSEEDSERLLVVLDRLLEYV